MLFREILNEEWKSSDEYGGFEFYCPVCKENFYSDRDGALMPFPCDHTIFLFQHAKGCYDCDIAVSYGINPIDKSKICSCWDFKSPEIKNEFYQRIIDVGNSIKLEDFPNVIDYYKCFFERIGDLDVDEIIYKYTEHPTFHDGWHFYAFGIKY